MSSQNGLQSSYAPFQIDEKLVAFLFCPDDMRHHLFEFSQSRTFSVSHWCMRLLRWISFRDQVYILHGRPPVNNQFIKLAIDILGGRSQSGK